MKIKKCRYLESSGCVGMCTNMCKIPTQKVHAVVPPHVGGGRGGCRRPSPASFPRVHAPHGLAAVGGRPAVAAPTLCCPCLLPPASCLLPPASCLLPPASCLLPPTSFYNLHPQRRPHPCCTAVLPALQFFTDTFGLPLYMEPNFEDLSCEMMFGQHPPALEADKLYSQPCFTSQVCVCVGGGMPLCGSSLLLQLLLLCRGGHASALVSSARDPTRSPPAAAAAVQPGHR